MPTTATLCLAEPALSEPASQSRTTHVLIAEADRFVADYLRAVLSSRGAQVGPAAASAHDALAQLDSFPQITAAAINMTLVDGPAWALARTLRARGVALLFIGSGYVRPPDDLEDVRVLNRPFAAHQVADALLRPA